MAHQIPNKKNYGFSLVELIASLVLAGILAAALMTIVVTAMNGFSLSRKAAGITQKANLALARIRLELLAAENIAAAENDRVVYTTDHGTFELLRSGTTITLEKTDAPAIAAKTLVDNIAADYGTDTFLTFEKQDGTNWTTADDFPALVGVTVKLKFSDYQADLDTTINPRENRVRNAPLLVNQNNGCAIRSFLAKLTPKFRTYPDATREWSKRPRIRGFKGWPDARGGMRPPSLPASRQPSRQFPV